jgi:hypothetical protein
MRHVLGISGPLYQLLHFNTGSISPVLLVWTLEKNGSDVDSNKNLLFDYGTHHAIEPFLGIQIALDQLVG